MKQVVPVALHIRTGVGITPLAAPGLTAPRGGYQCSINCPLHYNMCNVLYNYWYACMYVFACSMPKSYFALQTYITFISIPKLMYWNIR